MKPKGPVSYSRLGPMDPEQLRLEIAGELGARDRVTATARPTRERGLRQVRLPTTKGKE